MFIYIYTRAHIHCCPLNAHRSSTEPKVTPYNLLSNIFLSLQAHLTNDFTCTHFTHTMDSQSHFVRIYDISEHIVLGKNRNNIKSGKEVFSIFTLITNISLVLLNLGLWKVYMSLKIKKLWKHINEIHCILFNSKMSPEMV